MLVKDYTSLLEFRSKYKVGTDPELWGAKLWAMLHTYASENKYSKEWLDNFTYSIPCDSCYLEFKKFPHPKSGEDFFLWTFKVHSAVNKRLGHKDIELAKYLHFYMPNK